VHLHDALDGEALVGHDRAWHARNAKRATRRGKQRAGPRTSP
jgi:hypothetical protein